MKKMEDALAKILAPYSEHVYAVMRILFGLLFTFHGVQKVFGILSKHQPPVMSQLWIGGVLELVTGILLTIGLFTRGAAFLASGMMAVAYTQFHWKFQFSSHFFPAVNHGELAVLYAFIFLYIASRGAGSLSVDA